MRVLSAFARSKQDSSTHATSKLHYVCEGAVEVKGFKIRRTQHGAEFRLQLPH